MLQRKKLLYFITALVIVYSIYLRWLNLSRPLIYDELWAIMHLINKPTSEILTIFNNPNNHPLNTLWMKFAQYYWTDSPQILRLHSFIAGIAIPLLTGGVAWLLTSRKIIVALTIILCSLHSGLIYYSQVARGYSIEIMFIMLFMFLVLLYHTGTKKYRHINAAICIGIVLSFCLACFAQSTAILYLVPIIVVHTGYLLATNQQAQNNIANHILTVVRANIILISSYCLVTLFAVWIYIMHYNEFKSAVGPGAGFHIHSFADIITFITSISSSLFSWVILMGLISSIILKKYRFLAGLGIAFIIPTFIAGVIIKVGPPRVYLPLVPVCMIMTATGFYSLAIITKTLRKQLILLLPILLTSYMLISYQQRYFNWAEISFHKTIKWVNNYFPKGYHCYPPNAGMKITVYFPNEIQNNIKPFYDNMLFLYCGSADAIKALDVKGHVSTLKIKSAKKNAIININNNPVSKNIPISFYRLKKLHSDDINRHNIILANIPLQAYKTAKAAIGFLRTDSGSWDRLNCWFNPIRKSTTGEKIIGYQLISNNCQWSIEELQEIEQKSGGKIIFYKLVPISQSTIEEILKKQGFNAMPHKD